MVEELAVPEEGSHPIRFDSTYAKGFLTQTRMCLWKNNNVYWRCAPGMCSTSQACCHSHVDCLLGLAGSFKTHFSIDTRCHSWLIPSILCYAAVNELFAGFQEPTV